MLKATCECGATYQVPNELAGKNFKCRKCGGSVAAVVPRIDNATFLGALDALDQTGSQAQTLEVSHQQFKKLSQDVAKRQAHEQESLRLKEMQSSRLAIDPTPVASAPPRLTSSPSRPLRHEPARAQGKQEQVLHAMLGRLLLLPAILLFFISASVLDKVDEVVCEAPPDDIEFQLELMTQRVNETLKPTRSQAWVQALIYRVFGVMCIIGFAVRGIESSPDDESVKAFALFTTVYFLAAAVFMAIWPRVPRGLDSPLLEGLWWAAAAMSVCITLWAVLLFVGEDGWGRFLAAIFIGPYGAFYIMFGRPAGRLALIGAAGAGAVTFGVSGLEVITFAKYDTMDDAIAGRLAAPPPATPAPTIRAYPPLADGWALTPNPPPPSGDLPQTPPQPRIRLDVGPAGQAALATFPKARPKVNDADLAKLGSYESVGLFEFRPPAGFTRRELNPMLICWDAPGVKPEDSSMLVALSKRMPGTSLNDDLATGGPWVFLRFDETIMRFKQSEPTILERPDGIFLRLKRKPFGGLPGKKTDYSRGFYVLLEPDYTVVIQCTQDYRFDAEFDMFEASALTLRKRR